MIECLKRQEPAFVLNQQKMVGNWPNYFLIRHMKVYHNAGKKKKKYLNLDLQKKNILINGLFGMFFQGWSWVEASEENFSIFQYKCYDIPTCKYHRIVG